LLEVVVEAEAQDHIVKLAVVAVQVVTGLPLHQSLLAVAVVLKVL
jgi:hypothetical protein